MNDGAEVVIISPHDGQPYIIDRREWTLFDDPDLMLLLIAIIDLAIVTGAMLT